MALASDTFGATFTKLSLLPFTYKRYRIQSVTWVCHFCKSVTETVTCRCHFGDTFSATLVTLSPKAAPKCHLTMQENLIFFHFFHFWDMFSSKNVMNSKGFPFKNSICLSNVFVHNMCLGTIRAQILLSKIWAHLKGNIQVVKNNTKNSLVWPHPTVTMILMLLTKCNIDKFNGGKFYSVTC